MKLAANAMGRNMAWNCLGIFILLVSGSQAGAQLQLRPEPQPLHVFAGGVRELKVVWQNTSSSAIEVRVNARVHQASSATTIPSDLVRWKTVRLLPEQRVLESAPILFPQVFYETRF